MTEISLILICQNIKETYPGWEILPMTVSSKFAVRKEVVCLQVKLCREEPAAPAPEVTLPSVPAEVGIYPTLSCRLVTLLLHSVLVPEGLANL